MNKKNIWLDIITKLYRDLHMSDRVMHRSKESDKKRDRILNYFDRLEEIHQKISKSKREGDLKLLKKFYYNLYVIKPEDIPNSYFEHEKQIMRERGYGNIEITPERRQTLINQIIEDQKESLDKWIEYFLFDEESKSYEIWEKYWLFQGLQQLGKFNKETGKFSKRDKHTVYPFPPVEREAVFNTLKLMEEYIKDKKGDSEIRSALGSGNFKTLYEYSIKMIMNKGENQSNTTLGKWVKYEQGSDYHKLRDSLQGYYTGWCIAAGENFAKGQLENGDFYVYYTLDENGEAKVPRIAIRMNGHDEIGEIRGIANDQNMESEMMPILDKKLEEFPDRDKYKKKEYDMQFLTTIDNKVQKGYDLTIEELRFLYEVDSQIEGFGYERDPRIDEMRNKRNIINDLACIFDCMENEVCLGGDLPKDKMIKVYWDYLDLSSLTSVESLTLPQYIGDSLILSSLTSAEGLRLPEYIGGNLDLRSLTSAEDLEFPKQVRGYLYLGSLTSVEDLRLPEYIEGGLDLSGLINAKELKLPKYIEGYLDLSSLTSVESLTLPQYIGDSLILSSLTSAEGLRLPEYIGRHLNLRSLTSAKGLRLPEYINGNLDLNNLTNAKGLRLPEYISGNLNLNNLTNAEDLEFPKQVRGYLYLESLTSAEDLRLPEYIEGELDLSGLINVNGLKLPEQVGGNLYLNNLTSAEDLEFPKQVGGSLELDNLICAEDLELPEYIEGELVLSSLINAKGLILPKHIGCYLDLSSLISAKGLELPVYIGGELDLRRLTGVEGLRLPEYIGGNLDLNNLTSVESLILPQYIGGFLILSSLINADGLILPENFDIGNLFISKYIIEEIKMYPEKYYVKKKLY